MDTHNLKILKSFKYKYATMENPSKNNSAKKINEPETVYKSKSETDNEGLMHPVLIELIQKSKEHHKQGLNFSHEEAMKMIKEKYDFPK